MQRKSIGLKLQQQGSIWLTMSLDSLCSSFTINIMSKRERMVGMKSIFSSPFVSSQRPYTLFAAASTEHLEFKVVVIPAYKSITCKLTSFTALQAKHSKYPKCYSFVKFMYLSNRYGLLFHGFVNGNPVVFSHLVKFVNTHHPSISQHHRTSFHHKVPLQKI